MPCVHMRSVPGCTEYEFRFGIFVVVSDDEIVIVDKMHDWYQMFICMPHKTAIRVGLEYARRISNWRMYECAGTMDDVVDFANRWNLELPIEM